MALKVPRKKKREIFFSSSFASYVFFLWMNKVCSVSYSLFFFLSIKCMCASSIICSLCTTVFFFLLSFSILYVKKKNGVFSYIRYRIYSPCSFFKVRYHQRTSCCALSLSLFCLGQQPTQYSKLLISHFFLSE